MGYGKYNQDDGCRSSGSAIPNKYHGILAYRWSDWESWNVPVWLSMAVVGFIVATTFGAPATIVSGIGWSG